MQIRYSMRKDGEAEASGCSNDSFLLSLPTVRRRREKAKQLTPPANLYFLCTCRSSLEMQKWGIGEPRITPRSAWADTTKTSVSAVMTVSICCSD